MLITTIGLTSCASYKAQYHSTEKNWQAATLPNKPLAHQVYLIGDAGGGDENHPRNTLQLLGKQLEKADENSSIIFLGDNIYPNGLPKKGHPDRVTAEQNLTTQLDIVKDFAGNIFFIPGNHDWESEDGVKGVRRQEQFIQKYLKRGNTFLPNNGCSGPEVKKLAHNTVLIAIDSEWYLENWDTQTGINENCKYRTRQLFMMALMDKIKDNRHKNIILAMHHPLNSNGRHGGHFSAKEHLFPLSVINKNLMIPLPGIGSILALASNAFARPQELAHPNYQLFKQQLIDMSEKYTNVIFVSGHEHSLQYFEEEDQYFIVSGGGSRRTPVALGDDADFVAGNEGFSTLNIYEDGEVWVNFWATTDRKGNYLNQEQLIFKKKVRNPLPSEETLIPKSFPIYDQLKQQDSVLMSVVEPDELKVFNQTFWGDLHTEDYLTDFKMPVLDLATAKGGLIAIGRGGGNQTNSIRLKSKEGKIYQLRSIKKVTERFPSIVRKTFANDLAKQQLTAGHPFSAVVVAPMATAVKVFHTNPKIVYVPQQPNLGIYNDLGDDVYLFEERASGDWSDLASFGHPQKLVNTNTVIKGRLKNYKTVIDQSQVLRSRLFDMLIGDWDRHSDQWRWAAFSEGNKTVYNPIPRDRDQAYAKFDGIANALANYTVPFTRAADKFNGSISKRETTWLNYQARNFDRFFLNEMTLADWERAAKFIQSNLTDDIIEKAIQQLPLFSFEKEGKDYIEWTKSRRDDLLNTARRYYAILNKEVEILGTNKDNLFLIKRINDWQTKVAIYEYRKKKTEKRLLYERIIDNKVTDEIQLYGIDGNDTFELIGTVKNSPLIRLIGGNGLDSYKDKSSVQGLKRKTKIYDNLAEQSVLAVSKETKDKRSNRADQNSFDYLDAHYNYAIPIPIIGSNPDDGLFFQVNTTWNTFTFKRHQIHQFSGSYALNSGAFSFGYQADYFDMFDKWDTALKITAEVPRFVANFHGLGNETERNIDAFGRDYYRIRRRLLGIYPSFKKRGAGGSTFSVGPTLESIKIEEMVERITGAPEVPFNQAVFNQRYFAGANTSFSFFNADHPRIPTQGVGFEIGANWWANLEDVGRQLLRINTELGLYNRLGVSDFLVVTNRFQFGHLIGEYDFFQAINLGGRDNLRGFAQERFSGRTAFAHSIDLRIKVFNSKNNTLPISGGITPGFDYGRVWVDGESSDRWHTSYGGTIWFAPLDYIAFSAGMFFSGEENRLVVKAGLQF